MKLATIFTSMFLILTLGIVGCDSGGGDGGGGETGDECDPACKADETCKNGVCVENTIPEGDAIIPEEDIIGGDDCDATCVGKCGMVGECDCEGCDAGFTCVDATHTCAPDAADCTAVCTGKECGTFDGCNCGACGADETCNDTTGVCETGVCVPDCTGKQCGPDSCGGSCGLCPCVGCDPSATMCNDGTGMCEAKTGLSCVEINDCLSGCNPNDQACMQECMNQGTVDAQNQYNAIIQCLIDNGAQQCPSGDAQCQNDIILEHCMTEYETCFPAGTLSCSEVFDCMGACGAADQACLQDCFSQGSTEAQGQYGAIAECVIEQCGEQPTEECVNASQQGACAAVFADCFNLGKPNFATGPNGGSSKDFANIQAYLMILDKNKLY